MVEWRDGYIPAIIERFSSLKAISHTGHGVGDEESDESELSGKGSSIAAPVAVRELLYQQAT